MDYLATQGINALGSRLRRLLDRLDRDVAAIYRSADVRFEARWFPVFIALRDGGPLTVGALATRLSVTHAAVSQVRAALEAERLIDASPDPEDGRRQRLVLTPKGRALAAQLKPLWDAIATASSQVLNEGAPELMAHLDGLDAALDRRGLAARVDEIPNKETENDR
jgi:DNA-binding MarR family transcriptional regulator